MQPSFAFALIAFGTLLASCTTVTVLTGRYAGSGKPFTGHIVNDRLWLDEKGNCGGIVNGRFGYAKGAVECADGRKGEYEIRFPTWLRERGEGTVTVGQERIEFGL
jgi:hypothetical protein